MKILLLSDDAIRLQPDPGPLEIEPVQHGQQYSPFHMLASALAFCTFSVLHAWAEQTRQPIDDLVVDVNWKFSDDAPNRVAELQLRLDWPSLPEKKREAAMRVTEFCAIHATLRHSPTVTTVYGVSEAAPRPESQAHPEH